MAGPKQPIGLVKAKGKKHLTKAEIAEREASELKPCTDEIVAPSFLTAAQKKQFDKLAGQLKKLNIMGETDVETLGRYIVAQELYEKAVKDLRAMQKQQPKAMEAGALIMWAEALDKLDKRVDRYFKQATTAAKCLGLTISDRCKLVVPVKDEPVKVDKFAKFSVVPGGKEAAAND